MLTFLLAFKWNVLVAIPCLHNTFSLEFLRMIEFTDQVHRNVDSNITLRKLSSAEIRAQLFLNQ